MMETKQLTNDLSREDQQILKDLFYIGVKKGQDKVRQDSAEELIRSLQ